MCGLDIRNVERYLEGQKLKYKSTIRARNRKKLSPKARPRPSSLSPCLTTHNRLKPNTARWNEFSGKLLASCLHFPET